MAYNNLNQMTGILTSTQGTNGFPVGSASPGQALFNFVTYNFSATQDNGQIMSMVDARQGGNTVSYTYDSLKRLTNAQTTAWTQAITYDGFNNIATKTVPTGSAEPTFPGVNSANSQLSGATYDANGNMTAMPSAGPALAYDYENRAKSATMGSFVESYFYDESNRRVEKINSLNDFIYFYGVDGRLLSTFKATVSGSSYSLALVSNRVYFGGVLIGQAGLTAQLDASTLQDRLGTSNAGYPYGTDQASPPTTDDALDFASYSRDVNSGLEYAHSRYYSGGYGRFVTPDQSGASMDPRNPGSWGRYSYAQGDPVNNNDPSGNDPSGLFLSAEQCIADPDACQYEDSSSSSSGMYCPVAPQPGFAGNFAPVPGQGGLSLGCGFPPTSCGDIVCIPQHWEFDVGYTTVENLGKEGAFDHLFIYAYDQALGEGIVYDGGPSGSCPSCGNVSAWASATGHYSEILPWKNAHYISSIQETSIGPLGSSFFTLQSTLAATPFSYNPITGPNSNSVVYTLMSSLGIALPIKMTTDTITVPGVASFTEPVGLLNFQVNGQSQYFTGWGQFL